MCVLYKIRLRKLDMPGLSRSQVSRQMTSYKCKKSGFIFGGLFGFGQKFWRRRSSESASVERSESPKDPLLQLISLQKASGCWEMEPNLVKVFGKTEEEVVKQIPAQVELRVWATVLALIWLHGFKMDAQDEWHFVAMKAVAWIRSEKVANFSECVKVGNALLGCQVKEEDLGL